MATMTPKERRDWAKRVEARKEVVEAAKVSVWSTLARLLHKQGGYKKFPKDGVANAEFQGVKLHSLVGVYTTEWSNSGYPVTDPVKLTVKVSAPNLNRWGTIGRPKYYRIRKDRTLPWDSIISAVNDAAQQVRVQQDKRDQEKKNRDAAKKMVARIHATYPQLNGNHYAHKEDQVRAYLFSNGGEVRFEVKGPLSERQWRNICGMVVNDLELKK